MPHYFLTGLQIKFSRSFFFPCNSVPSYPLKCMIHDNKMEKPRDFDPFGQTGWSPLATI